MYAHRTYTVQWWSCKEWGLKILAIIFVDKASNFHPISNWFFQCSIRYGVVANI